MTEEIKITDVSLLLGMSFALNVLLINKLTELGHSSEEFKETMSRIEIGLTWTYYQDKK